MSVSDDLPPAGRLLIFKARQPVKEPGSRGGRGFRNEHGDWRYGTPPRGDTRGRSSQVTGEQIRERLAHAEHEFPNDYSAARLEVLLQPHVYRVWRKLNPTWHVERAHNKAFGPGYVVYQMSPVAGGTRLPWNSVRDDDFRHSPSTAWDGVYRNTVHRFVEDLINETRSKGDGHPSTDTLLAAHRAGLRFVKDTGLPDGFAVGDRLRGANSGREMTVVGGMNGELLCQDAAGERYTISTESVASGRILRVAEAPDPGVASSAPKMTWAADGIFDRTGDVRFPKAGEYFIAVNGHIAQATVDFTGAAYPILERTAETSGVGGAELRQPYGRDTGTALTRGGPSFAKAEKKAPLFADADEPDGAWMLGKTKRGKKVFASGGESGGFNDADHHDAGVLHHRAHEHHQALADSHADMAEDDDDWQRSEDHHDEAERHEALAAHHASLAQEHLTAGGHGGTIGLDFRGADGPVTQKVEPYSPADRKAAKDRLAKRTVHDHPGGVKDSDRARYALLQGEADDEEKGSAGAPRR